MYLSELGSESINHTCLPSLASSFERWLHMLHYSCTTEEA